MYLARRVFAVLLVAGMVLVSAGSVSAADPIPDHGYATPVFGLAAAPDGSLLVADAGAGVVELRSGQGGLVVSLPGVADVAPIGRGSMFAITGGTDLSSPDAGNLYRVSRGSLHAVADLDAFEAAVNPDGGEVDSNAFDVEVLDGGRALVADAGGNTLLIAGVDGSVDWVATLPDELVSTAHAKQLVGCPTDDPFLGFVCGLPDMMPAEAVASSVAVGPDGAYYVGELKGFPGPTGESRIWRIEPGTLHAECGASPACSVVADGFTSIVDLAFGPDGTLYVVEFDENSFLAVEVFPILGPAALAGGTINACDSSTWSCGPVASGLTLPIAVAVDKQGNVSAAVEALLPSAHVIALP